MPINYEVVPGLLYPCICIPFVLYGSTMGVSCLSIYPSICQYGNEFWKCDASKLCSQSIDVSIYLSLTYLYVCSLCKQYGSTISFDVYLVMYLALYVSIDVYTVYLFIYVSIYTVPIHLFDMFWGTSSVSSLSIYTPTRYEVVLGVLYPSIIYPSTYSGIALRVIHLYIHN